MRKIEERKTLRTLLAELRQGKQPRREIVKEILEELGYARRAVGGNKIETR